MFLRLFFAFIILMAGAYLIAPTILVLYNMKFPFDDKTLHQHLIIIGFLLCFISIVTALSVLLGMSSAVAEPPASAALRDMVGQLNENYGLLRTQLKLGLAVAVFTILLGTLTIVVSVCAALGLIPNLPASAQEASKVTALLGIVADMIAGVGMYLFRINFDRINTVGDRIDKLLANLILLEQAPDEETKKKAYFIILGTYYGSAFKPSPNPSPIVPRANAQQAPKKQ